MTKETANNSAVKNASWEKSLPNIITGIRFFFVPIFIILMLKPTPDRMLWSAAIFLLASVTDWLDGYLARVYDAESILGKLLDPLADKVLVLAALVMLCAHPGGARVAPWMVILLLSREFLVMGLRSLAAVKGTVVAASYWAKHKTAWTMIALTCLLVDRSHSFFSISFNFNLIGTFAIWVALALSIWSGWQYAYRLKKFIFESE